MKGQINFEYIATLTLFIILVSYLSLQIARITPNYLYAMKEEYVKSEAYQLSELLINDDGEPADWTNIWLTSPSSVKRFGLSAGNRMNVLSSEKITLLDTICKASYESVSRRLGVNTTDYSFSVFVVESDGTAQLACSPPQNITERMIASVKRAVALDSGKHGEITVQVW